MELPTTLIAQYADDLATSSSEQTPQETKPRRLPSLRVEHLKRGNKIATLIIGHTGTDEDVETLAKQLKQTLAVGGSVRDGEILLQGAIAQKTTELLQSWGYKTRNLSV